MKSLRKMTLAVVATGALMTPVGVTVATAAPAAAGCVTPAGDPCPTSAQLEAAARQKVIDRAAKWMNGYKGGVVPYSMSRWIKSGTIYSSYQSGSWRTDCSGYASMALQIPSSYGGPNTEALATTTYTTKLSGISQLRKGDLIIDPRTSDGDFRHVVIFQKWKDASNKSLGYWAYEQRGTYGTTHRVLKYGIGADHYDLYSPKKLNY